MGCVEGGRACWPQQENQDAGVLQKGAWATLGPARLGDAPCSAGGGLRLCPG